MIQIKKGSHVCIICKKEAKNPIETENGTEYVCDTHLAEYKIITDPTL